ncbi:MAG TPA: hypothetical protein O0X39_06380 [Methanocorpusculum sp.]|nr:hypothetical protein [Methanocorpusculum sp.]
MDIIIPDGAESSDMQIASAAKKSWKFTTERGIFFMLSMALSVLVLLIFYYPPAFMYLQYYLSNIQTPPLLLSQQSINAFILLVIFVVLFDIFAVLIFYKGFFEKLQIKASRNVKICAALAALATDLIFVCFACMSLIYISSAVSMDYLPYLGIGALFGVLVFYVLYLFARYFIVRFLIPAVQNDGLKAVIIFGITSAIWVFIPLLSLYYKNINNVTLVFVLLLGVVYVIGTVYLYFIALAVFKSSFAAFIVCLIGWLCLSFAETVCTALNDSIGCAALLYSLVMLCLMAAGGYLVIRLTKKFNLPVQKISKWILILAVVLIVISAVPVAVYFISSAGDIAHVTTATEFTADESLPHPNIYWIHGESMLDPYVVEKYWGKDSVDFVQKLEDRGFEFNHNAYISGKYSGYTQASLSGLFVPSLYDEENSHGGSGSSGFVMNNALKYNHELINALDTAGYQTTSDMMKSSLRYIQSPSKIRYLYDEDSIYTTHQRDVSLLDEILYYDMEMEKGFTAYSAYPLYKLLADLKFDEKIEDVYEATISLNKMVKNSSIAGYVSDETKAAILPENDWLARHGYSNMIDILSYALDNGESPRMIFIDCNLCHTPYYVSEDGSKINENTLVQNYFGQYQFSEKVLLYLVDRILEQDPDAVIIIQGDHGPYFADEKENAGFFPDGTNADEYKYRVLSAFRIPEQYRTDEYAKLFDDPHNIVRYLINSYVGPSFDYVPAKET